MSATTLFKKEYRCFFRDKPVRDLCLSFVPTFRLSVVCLYSDAFGKIIFPKSCSRSTIRLGFMRSAGGHILLPLNL